MGTWNFLLVFILIWTNLHLMELFLKLQTLFCDSSDFYTFYDKMTNQHFQEHAWDFPNAFLDFWMQEEDMLSLCILENTDLHLKYHIWQNIVQILHSSCYVCFVCCFKLLASTKAKPRPSKAKMKLRYSQRYMKKKF